jgi:hypothetical protein
MEVFFATMSFFESSNALQTSEYQVNSCIGDTFDLIVSARGTDFVSRIIFVNEF